MEVVLLVAVAVAPVGVVVCSSWRLVVVGKTSSSSVGVVAATVVVAFVPPAFVVVRG